MASLVKHWGPPPLRRARNTFEALARAIIAQQVSGAAARAITARFIDLFPGRGFPTPAQVTALQPPVLRSAGLSRQKATYVKDLAKHYEDGSIPSRRFSRMSDEAIADLLTDVKGIGQWTVDMFLIFALNRPDVLPLGDLGIKKGFQRLLGMKRLPRASEMQQRAEPWRPYRSVASWYLWRANETEAWE